MSRHDGGKGDRPRPFSVDLEKFAENFDLIFGKKEKHESLKKENPDRPAQEGAMLEQTGDGDIQRMDNER